MSALPVEQFDSEPFDSERPEDAPVLDALDPLARHGRHASLLVLCEWLHQILAGRHAERLLEEDRIPDHCGVWVAPSFGWLYSRIDVGRKDRGPRGERLRLPVRLQWAEPVVLLPGGNGRHAFSWSTTSMGHTGTGTTHVEPACLFEAETHENEAGIPLSVQVPALTRDQAVALLARVAEEGRLARWAFMADVETKVRTAVLRAHASLSREVGEYHGRDLPLLDETKIAGVVDTMMWGVGDHQGKVAAMLERLLDPVTLNKVDPMHYIHVALRRDAKEAVRQAVGDPRIGKSVRDLHRELGRPDIEVLVATFRERNPASRLSTDRAAAALSVQPDVMADWWSYDAPDAPHHDEHHDADYDTDGDYSGLAGLFEEPDEAA